MNPKLVTLLRDARISRGLKQKDVARRVGIKDNTLSNWETGRTEPDMDTFLALCDIYDIDAADALTLAYGGSRVKTICSTEERSLVEAYRKASEDDRAVVDAALRKYMIKDSAMGDDTKMA